MSRGDGNLGDILFRHMSTSARCVDSMSGREIHWSPWRQPISNGIRLAGRIPRKTVSLCALFITNSSTEAPLPSRLTFIFKCQTGPMTSMASPNGWQCSMEKLCGSRNARPIVPSLPLWPGMLERCFRGGEVFKKWTRTLPCHAFRKKGTLFIT